MKKNITFTAFWLSFFFWTFDSLIQYLVNKPHSDLFFVSYKLIQFICFLIIANALKSYSK